MLTLTFHGHACFTLEADGRRVIIDPFLTGNPATDIPLARLPKIDAVLLSHGHGDHLGDAIPIARRDGATIIATAELARFCGERGATVHAHDPIALVNAASRLPDIQLFQDRYDAARGTDAVMLCTPWRAWGGNG